jgi:hypothetical protein
MLIRAIIAKMRHDGCGGLPCRAELLTGISAAHRAAGQQKTKPTIQRHSVAALWRAFR